MLFFLMLFLVIANYLGEILDILKPYELIFCHANAFVLISSRKLNVST